MICRFHWKYYVFSRIYYGWVLPLRHRRDGSIEALTSRRIGIGEDRDTVVGHGKRANGHPGGQVAGPLHGVSVARYAGKADGHTGLRHREAADAIERRVVFRSHSHND